MYGNVVRDARIWLYSDLSEYPRRDSSLAPAKCPKMRNRMISPVVWVIFEYNEILDVLSFVYLKCIINDETM